MRQILETTFLSKPPGPGTQFHLDDLLGFWFSFLAGEEIIIAVHHKVCYDQTSASSQQHQLSIVMLYYYLILWCVGQFL